MSMFAVFELLLLFEHYKFGNSITRHGCSIPLLVFCNA